MPQNLRFFVAPKIWGKSWSHPTRGVREREFTPLKSPDYSGLGKLLSNFASKYSAKNLSPIIKRQPSNLSHVFLVPRSRMLWRGSNFSSEKSLWESTPFGFFKLSETKNRQRSEDTFGWEKMKGDKWVKCTLSGDSWKVFIASKLAVQQDYRLFCSEGNVERKSIILSDFKRFARSQMISINGILKFSSPLIQWCQKKDQLELGLSNPRCVCFWTIFFSDNWSDHLKKAYRKGKKAGAQIHAHSSQVMAGSESLRPLC